MAEGLIIQPLIAYSAVCARVMMRPAITDLLSPHIPTYWRTHTYLGYLASSLLRSRMDHPPIEEFPQQGPCLQRELGVNRFCMSHPVWHVTVRHCSRLLLKYLIPIYRAM